MMVIYVYYVIIFWGVCYVVLNFIVLILRKEKMLGVWLKLKYNNL